MKNKNNYAFTLIELIVSITILIILSTIGFVSYVSNISDARDSERKTDLSQISSSLKLYKQRRGVYPLPGNNFNITNSGTIVAIQGLLNTNVPLNTMNKIPLDPYIELPYFYSISKRKQEFQLSLSLENQDENKALLLGDYKTISKNVVPTIVLAISSSSDVEIHDGIGAGTINRTKFIFDNGFHNLPYSFEDDYSTYSDGTSFTGILDDNSINFWQNSDFRTCTEIYEAGKAIHNGYEEEYQIVSNTGALTNTGCTF